MLFIHLSFSKNKSVTSLMLSIATLLCLPVIPLPSFAENRMADSINLMTAIQRTTEYHPDLKKYQHQFEAQKGHEIQAGVSMPLEVNVSIEDILGTGALTGIDNAESSLSISWALDDKIINKKVSLESSKKDIIELEKQIKKIDLAAQTAHYFLNTLALQDRLKISDLSVKQQQKTIVQIKKRVDAGRTSISDLLRAEAELEKALLQQEGFLHEIKSSKRMLVAQWGEKNPDFKTLKGSLAIEPRFMTLPELEQKLATSPSLKRFMILKSMTQAKIDLAQVQSKPLWNVSAGVRRYESTGDVGLMAGVTIPIMKANRNQGLITALTAEQNQQQSELNALQKNAEAQLFVLYQELLHAQHVKEALQERIIPSLNKALDETTRVYLQGKYSFMELTSVHRDVLKAKTELIEANLMIYMTIIEIEKLTGIQLTRLNEST